MTETHQDALLRWAPLSAALAQDIKDVSAGEAGNASLAAVLILLYDKLGEPHIVLTRRTDYVAAHKGEISLPGGAYEVDRDPTLLHTALREAVEEVGIESEAVHILGRLPTVLTRLSNYAIIPYVAATAILPIFRPDPFEVAEVLEVPLAALRRPEAWQEEDWQLEGEAQRVSFYQHQQHKIWGATARILYEFFTILDTLEV